MRTLGNFFWLYAIMQIIVIFYVCFVNIFIRVRYKHSIVAIGIHISSAFLIVCVFCYMIDMVVLDLPFESFYKICALVSLILFGVSCAGNVMILCYQHRKEHRFFNLPPNLEMIFSSVEDLAFVADYKGNIIQVNHPQKFSILFREENTLGGILNKLNGCFCETAPRPEDITNAKSSMQYEIYINETDDYYNLIISPIFASELRIGFSVLIFDITAIKRSEITLQEQNTALEEANNTLINYVKIAGSLEAQTERLRILKNILSLLIVKIENSKENIHNLQNNYNNKSSTEYKQNIREIAGELRNIYMDVRASVCQISKGDN